MSRYLIKVPSISCNHCKMRISKAFAEINEKNFEVNVADKVILIETDNIELITKKLEEIDYPAEEVVEY